jgi:hypothetical protein
LPVEAEAFLWLSAAARRGGDTDAASVALASYGNLVPDERYAAAKQHVAESLRLQQRLRLTSVRAPSGHRIP